MGKLRKLQERYLKGELTKAQYEAECKKLGLMSRKSTN